MTTQNNVILQTDIATIIAAINAEASRRNVTITPVSVPAQNTLAIAQTANDLIPQLVEINAKHINCTCDNVCTCNPYYCGIVGTHYSYAAQPAAVHTGTGTSKTLAAKTTDFVATSSFILAATFNNIVNDISALASQCACNLNTCTTVSCPVNPACAANLSPTGCSPNCACNGQTVVYCPCNATCYQRYSYCTCMSAGRNSTGCVQGYAYTYSCPCQVVYLRTDCTCQGNCACNGQCTPNCICNSVCNCEFN